MKLILFMVAIIATFSSSFGQGGGSKSPHDTVTNGNVTVTYGRPYKKGRDIFGGLEKYGEMWRLGADAATTITLAKDAKVGNQDIKAGTYALFAIPNQNEWTLIFNSQVKQWGAYDYDKFRDKNVARVSVPATRLDNIVEQLTIQLDAQNTMTIEWDKTQVKVPISM